MPGLGCRRLSSWFVCISGGMEVVGKTASRQIHILASRRNITVSPRCLQQAGSIRHASTICLPKSRAIRPRIHHNDIVPAIGLKAGLGIRSISTDPTFTYGVAASFTAKGARYNPQKDVFTFRPKDPIYKHRADKRTRPVSGQDAFFVSTVGSVGGLAFGVADGVGGWADSGIDPADFSHAFCDFMAHTAHEYTLGGRATALAARELMQKGYDGVVADGEIYAGGSTACVGVARPDGSLEVANLGDSGFLQLRLNAVHHHTEPQTHAFNTPYQLSVIPEVMRARGAAFGGVQLQDFPKDASVTKHALRHGDVLVFATDGVWDNLTSSDVLRTVSRLLVQSGAWQHTDDGIKVSESLSRFIRPGEMQHGADKLQSLQSLLAVAITGDAKAASVNTKVDGPFAREVKRHFPEEDWRGGKVDDICVVIAIVVEDGL